MSVYGFRLHTIEAFDGHRRAKAIEFAEDEMVGALEADLRPLEGLTFTRAPVYKPADALDDESVPVRTPVMRIDTVRREGSRLEVEVGYGRTGEHSFLLGSDGSVRDLHGWAPARRYISVFYGARVGARGAMVSSVAGRTFAGELLMRRASVQAALRADQPDASGAWRRWVPRVMVDQHRIEEVAQKGDLEGIQLERRSFDAAGNLTRRPVTLTQSGVLKKHTPHVTELLKRWVSAAAGERTLSKSAEVSALVELVDGDVGALGFTDGKLSFKENDKTQTIGPSTLDRILVYPVGSEPLDAPALRRHGSERIRPLSEVLGLAVDLD